MMLDKANALVRKYPLGAIVVVSIAAVALAQATGIYGKVSSAVTSATNAVKKAIGQAA